jgi:signal transduction histidine kinase
MTGPRPLDRLRSIKIKLGILVAVSVSVSSLMVWYGLYHLGWRPRYTLPVAVIVALAVTQVLAHGMTSPLRSMTAAAAAMARGDYSRRVRATSRDEVGELGRAFNQMAADLEAADAQRRELIANVSHELRTPIAALQAVLENLVDGVADPAPATMRAALDQTERLGRLVRELLDLSRIDAGTEPINREDVDVTVALDAVVDEARMNARTVRFEIEVSPPDATAWADPARLHQVVANLLDNAARHSPTGGTVRIRASVDAHGLHLDVTDEGPGIPPAERELVFERFHRGAGRTLAGTGGAAAGTASTDGTGGTGLGLAIARWAVALHDGHIRVAEMPAGCRFVVDLPGRPT